MSEQNKALVRRLYEEVVNKGNLGVADELVADSYIGHSSSPGTETRGREGYKQFFTIFRGAFPDLHLTIEGQVAEGDVVASRWTASGTHEGDFFGIPASGKQGSITGMTMDRIAEGQVVECWTNSDDLGLLQQIGAVPSPSAG